ncbi:hypothetical protein ACFE04_023973 [Oxalis oulophora]
MDLDHYAGGSDKDSKTHLENGHDNESRNSESHLDIVEQNESSSDFRSQIEVSGGSGSSRLSGSHGDESGSSNSPLRYHQQVGDSSRSSGSHKEHSDGSGSYRDEISHCENGDGSRSQSTRHSDGSESSKRSMGSDVHWEPYTDPWDENGDGKQSGSISILREDSSNLFEIHPDIINEYGNEEIFDAFLNSSSFEIEPEAVDRTENSINELFNKSFPTEKLKKPCSSSSISSSSSEDLFQVDIKKNPESNSLPKPVEVVIQPTVSHDDKVDTSNKDLLKSDEHNNTSSPTSTFDFSRESLTNQILPTESPPIQTMDRSSEGEHNRISSSAYKGRKDWSVASSDSLFSIHLGNTSFSREQALLMGGDLCKSGEFTVISPHTPVNEIEPGKISVAEVVKVAADKSKPDEKISKSEDQSEEKTTAPKVLRNSSTISSESGASRQSFAFPIRRMQKRFIEISHYCKGGASEAKIADASLGEGGAVVKEYLCILDIRNLILIASCGNLIISEKEILLEFKSSVIDPYNVLSSWNTSSNNHCSWFGITCNSKSKVVSFNLTATSVIHGYNGGKLGGELSPVIGLFTELRVLSIAFNDLHGQIPIEIWGLEKLEVLDLEGNFFTGNLPDRFVGLRKLRVLNLGFNRLSGEIPAWISRCVELEVLNLSGNKLKGNIYPFCASLRKVKGLCGVMLRARSSTVGYSRSLLAWSHYVSSSNLSGSSVYAETNSTSSLEMKSGNSGMTSIELACIISISAIVLLLLVLIVFFLYTRRRRTPKSRIQAVDSREITIFSSIGVPLTFENIVRSTANFNASNCIGNGGFGATYKAEVSPGILLAVKRLAVGRCQGFQQFDAEIKSLGMVKHPNLVTLVGYHASETETFLIYNYLPGGNLENFIRERSLRPFDWKILHKIALNVASALSYLHDQCSPKIIHRDVKPSNILLDSDHNAYLSDFGLSRVLGNSQSHVTTGVAGTFGYVAPEYAMTCRVSEKSDVYSYGVVLLELVSDKKALDPSFSSEPNGFNIISWALMMLRQGQAKDVFTAGLWDAGPHDDLVDVLYLAIQCTVERLTTRPTMRQAVQRLRKIQPS